MLERHKYRECFCFKIFEESLWNKTNDSFGFQVKIMYSLFLQARMCISSSTLEMVLMKSWRLAAWSTAQLVPLNTLTSTSNH